MQLDVVAAAPRERRLLIGEAKWGRRPPSQRILTDLIERSQRMPQVAEGWTTQYTLFTREGFSDALKQQADSMDALLISLEQIENVLLEA